MNRMEETGDVGPAVGEEKLPQPVDYYKIVDLVSKLAATLALVAASWWFLARGEQLPRVELSHQLRAECFDKDVRWVRATVKVSNVGEVRVDFAKSVHQLNQVIPVEKGLLRRFREGDQYGLTGTTRIAWPLLAEQESQPRDLFLEPKESQTQHVDFLIPDGPELIEVRSFYPNTAVGDKNTVVGWQVVSLLDIGENKCDM